jgi:Flp pilus assembly protein TadG
MSVHRRGRDRESGVSAVELVVWTPLLFLVMFAAVQFGLDLFAQHVAISAAQEGAREARDNAYPDEQAGQDWAGASTQYAETWANGLISGLIASNSLNSNAVPANYIDFQDTANPEVGVTVTFNVISVIPFAQLHVTATSQGPVECFYNLATEQCVGG